jgi:beta-glucanase (GH16 family)
MAGQLYVIEGTNGVADRLRPVVGGADIPFVAPNPTAPAGMTQVFVDQFGALDTTAWFPYDNSNFGAPDRVQLYKSANAVFGSGSAGAGNGTSLKLLSKRETVVAGGVTYNFTAGMLDTKSVGRYFPRYGRFEFRCKTPHGQGLWPSIWITAKNGGATTAEMDILEYFHGQLPGKNSTTLHGTQNDGSFKANRYTNNQNRTFFEHPTYTPDWHVWAQDILPVTDSSGTTPASATAPSSYVKYTTYLDGVAVYSFVDTSATYYTTNGGDADSFWQIYAQGCQVDGPFVGGIDDPLGYSHEKNQCLISGTPPNTCAITRDGTNFVQRAQFGDPSSVLEVDYVRVYKYTP